MSSPNSPIDASVIPLGALPKTGRVRIRLVGVRHALDSFELLFFLNLPRGDEATANRQHPRFVGSLFMYGLGAPSLPGEATPVTAPFDLTLDIPPDVAARAANHSDDVLSVILARPDGRRLESTHLRFDHVSVQPLSK